MKLLFLLGLIVPGKFNSYHYLKYNIFCANYEITLVSMPNATCCNFENKNYILSMRQMVCFILSSILVIFQCRYLITLFAKLNCVLVKYRSWNNVENTYIHATSLNISNSDLHYESPIFLFFHRERHSSTKLSRRQLTHWHYMMDAIIQYFWEYHNMSERVLHVYFELDQRMDLWKE